MLVDDPDVPEKVREHLQVIKKHAAMQARLIDDLLDVTKIAKGKFQLSLAVIDVHEVLRTVVETCSADLESKQLALSIELKATNYHLGADADRLQQVFWNLLKNAINYTSPEGRVVMRTINPRSDLLRVEVQDTGKGISSELMTRMFEAFEEGEGSQGLGLGLAISKGIIELHSGTIRGSSERLGKGSTFVVELPVG
jgi:signal transduction histidine kinase